MHNDARYQRALELTQKAETKEQAGPSTSKGRGRGRGRGRGYGYNQGPPGYPPYSQFGFQAFGFPQTPVQAYGFPQVQPHQPQQYAQPYTPATTVMCYNCGATGHISKHCPLKPPAAAGAPPK